MIFNRITTKYQSCLALSEIDRTENYTTNMQWICKFACYDGYRIIATFQEHFSYADTSFSALPLFYTVKQNTRSDDLCKTNCHTIEIYSLWYDKDLKTKLNKYISSEVEILTNNRLRQIFKLTVLPKTVLKNLSMIQEINCEQENNTISLTVKRKHVELPNDPNFAYQTI